MAHALLGPSSAERWMACPPSVLLTKDMPNETSDFALEGTVAHAVCENKLLSLLGKITEKQCNSEIEKLKKHRLYDKEMLDHAETYTDFVMEQVYAYTNPFVAVEQKIKFADYVPDGFGTADCLLVGGQTLQVIDFKYGKGVEVSPVENKQMLLYALGAWLSINLFYDIKHIKMSIVQPRIGNIETWECDLEYLLQFAEEAKKKAALAVKGEGEFNPGEHCKFCKAKATCRALADKNMELAKFEFRKPPELTPEEVGAILEQGKQLQDWIKGLQDWALQECLNGKEVPGWKAVNGRSVREFKNTDDAIKVLTSNGIDEALLYKRTTLTLAQMEKVIGKKPFNDLVGDLIIKNPGKPTLVAVSDKRQAISNVINAVDEFSAVNK
ncbi:hypothetical protein IX317_000609 [Fusobacterium sp. DD29]|uniref:DUF2800 domain-containing protein n=1 Tax=unclassified Fusobacterium TaxID=2648384 RepID=UPI001B8CBA75|nr:MULTISPECIES: DUF2800 domain-containing protein [unclassified Fusobacterium]MBR8700269.1 hypothetical protein [Fusobacterium sp. DD45]MBR8710476.1 hypothetical protein [Fusobacterium sp. DD28]MBR8748948.1 hypothetical protein [Fusobacterium sp. DD29]MBR8751074.1 hypothetical protein [Fusobacterium sp. DD26]MBR8761254.1 hypothetical protein [Fusobacterium sp. DD25]